MRTAASFFASGLIVLTGWVAACSDTGGGSQVNGNGGSGGSAASGTGGFAAGAGAGGSGATASSLCNSGCACDTHSGELLPLDMLIVLDKSGSMSQNNYWGPITNAISSFLSLPGSAGIGMGLNFFPLAPSQPPPTQPCTSGADCTPYGCIPIFNQCSGAVSPNESCVYTDYQNPAVPVALLPGVGSQINTAISSTSPGGGTPMDPALHGGIAYMQGFAQANPEHISVVVLATDGEPSDTCNPNQVATVAARAQQGYEGNPSILTFVIGIGSQLTSLNQIAASGGTDQALIIGGSADPGGEFLDALNQIRGAVGCSYKIPTPSAGANPDYERVNVIFAPDGSDDDEIIGNVGSATECQGQAGWYYDNPADPTRILLCPASCDRVETVKGSVSVVLGCETVPR